jgi:hypothetical protein
VTQPHKTLVTMSHDATLVEGGSSHTIFDLGEVQNKLVCPLSCPWFGYLRSFRSVKDSYKEAQKHMNIEN